MRSTYRRIQYFIAQVEYKLYQYCSSYRLVVLTGNENTVDRQLQSSAFNSKASLLNSHPSLKGQQDIPPLYE